VNTDKLLFLLDRQRERRAGYGQLTARYRQALRDVGNLQAELTADVDDLAGALVLLDTDALAVAPAEDLQAAGIGEGQRRRLVAARRLAERLGAEAATTADALKQSQTLVDNLIEYARQRGESVAL
jgi:AICAR transformylase/IMP cyclohydrolase PurH